MEKKLLAGKPLWKNTDYLLLWLGQTVSWLGTGISQFAFPLIVLAITNSYAAAGFAGALGQLPYLLFSLPAGALVDRWNRKLVMIVCTLGLTLCLASIPIALISGHITTLHLYIVSFVMGIFFIFYELAELAALTRLVPKAQLSTAVAQNEAAYSSVQLLAPSLGGVLLSIGRAFPFVADVLSYLILLGALLGIRGSFQQERQEAPRHLLVDVWEGLRWLWAHVVVRALAFLTGYFYVVMSGSILIVYAIARQHHISYILVGALLALGGGGNIVGTLLSPFVQHRVRFGQAVGFMLLLFVVLWPLYGLANTPLWLGIVVAAIAVIDSIASILIASYRLTVVPDALQGRVGSIYRLIISGSLTLGLALIGQSLERFGIVVTVSALWTGLIFFAVFIFVTPHLRQAVFPHDEVLA